MKKIVPFKKNIIFEKNINEITSISLEHNLNHKDNLVEGTFVVSGEYKSSETSLAEAFKHELPFAINIDEKYKLDNVNIDIDDFYYEIIDDSVLSVNIDVSLDNLEEQEVRCIEEEQVKDNSSETYQSYTVYIVRNGDTIENIIDNYNVTKDILLEYNDLTELKTGDKIIIPC